MNIPDYLKDIKTERQFRLDGRTIADPNATDLWNRALNSIQRKEDLELLSSAFEFANKIEYRHMGMSSEIYFMHPMRTAAFALLCEERQNIDFGIVGLLHNVFELSDMAPEILASVFNESISNQILALTVDRNLQWDLAYKQDYYDGINSNPLSCRVVKIFDKLDNLFVLGLNPDAVTREKYLAEIRTHIIPMADRDLPSVFPYLSQLVDECESTGFLSN
jgi:(p)ppGpp synthase/HD superfamily hydrolase